MTVSMGSSTFTSGIGYIAHDFDVSILAATLGLSLYVAGISAGPLVFAPMSEVYGRRAVYVPTWALFFLFQLGCSLAPNIEAFLICRFLVGAFGSPVLTVAAGSFSDIWKTHELGPPLGLFTMTAFLGPTLGPVIGGFIVEYMKGESWRWCFWIQVIITGAMIPAMLWLPETYAATIIEQKTGKPLRRKSKPEVFGTAIWRPLQLLFLEPIVLLVSLYISFLFGILYLFFGAYPYVFHKYHGFSPSQVGLSFLGIALGVILSLPTAGIANKIYLRLRAENPHRDTMAEARLPVAIPAATIAPVSLFWFAWTCSSKIHWIVPTISGVLFGWSMVILFICQISYIAETFLVYSASVIAANTIMRSLFAAGFPLFGRNLYAVLGEKWAGSLLGFIAVAFMPVPWAFYKYGGRIVGGGWYERDIEKQGEVRRADEGV
ncbi:MFS general substrate transporter [Choiromyces venosus 120613-1]|uniref:MFS general substrate transporter n=1 Tax=Choiromyces venosus 120613-1 TaxID=1336337 RepID=A0A3N4J4X1_9PEZI|nr:MFS general substrate transporter [Choiromyces venosus 120613-1]